MPRLRGFSATQLNEMRRFYEAWYLLDSSNPTIKDLSVATDNLQRANNQIDIFNTIVIPNLADFPIEDFFKVPFTHHTRIMAKCKELPARYYYIHRTVEEHLSVDALEKIIKQQAFENQDKLPNNFSKTIYYCPLNFLH